MPSASPGEENRKKQKWGGVLGYMRNECERRRLPAPFHTSRESPHHPVDEGPRVQCGALPPQTSLIGGKENEGRVDLYFQGEGGGTIIT